jgi:nucleotide-binding universal stress UspA family protein
MSAIRSVLLHLDATGSSVARLAFARDLAGRYGAALTALFGVHPDPERVAFAYSAGAALRAAEEGADAHWAAERARLRELCVQAAPEPTWCEVIGDTVTHGFLAEAAYADLLVVGAPADSHRRGGPPPGFVEAAILDSGTPAIVVPNRPLPATPGQRILVAWNGSPPATRALHAALPLLAEAEQVDVASWGGPPPAAPYSRVDVGEWLRRHGIACRMHRRAATAGIGEALVALAAELQSDLVVMGCYGHGRLRERVFGGVSRSLLATLPVPLLMSH